MTWWVSVMELCYKELRKRSNLNELLKADVRRDFDSFHSKLWPNHWLINGCLKTSIFFSYNSINMMQFPRDHSFIPNRVKALSRSPRSGKAWNEATWPTTRRVMTTTTAPRHCKSLCEGATTPPPSTGRCGCSKAAKTPCSSPGDSSGWPVRTLDWLTLRWDHYLLMLSLKGCYVIGIVTK